MYKILQKISLATFLSFQCLLLPAQKMLENFVLYSDQDIPSKSNYKIFEDSRGYIWVGSKNGLYKFDGFSFQPYYSFYDDSTTLTSNSITDIEEDTNGFLWISTASDGVVKLDPYTGKMKQYPALTLSSNPVYPVWDIFKDENNILWFGTGGRGIVRYFPEKDSFTNYVVDPGRISNGSVRFENEIKENTADPHDKNILWAAGMEGLFRFNKTTGRAEKFENIIDGKKAWRDNSFHCIYIDGMQQIWLGTWAGGLVKFDYTNKKFSHYQISDKDYAKNDLSKNVILDIMPGPDQQLYISSADAGFIAFDKTTGVFSLLIDKKKLPDGEMFAYSASSTKNGSLWIAGEGFIILQHPLYNRFQKKIDLTAYEENKNRQLFFKDAVYDTGRKKYLISLTGRNALLELNADLSLSSWIKSPLADLRSSLGNVFFDNKGRLFVGSSAAPYLLFLDKSKKVLLPVAGNLIEKNKFPVKMSARSVKFDGKRNIWIAYNVNQLITWDIEKNSIKQYAVTVSKESGLPDNVFIIDMALDGLSNVWLATNTGLIKFDSRTEKFEHYYSKARTSTELASNYLNALAVDKENKIWIAPQYQGIQVFDPALKKVVHNYAAGRGSFSNHIDEITCDSRNNIWCTSNTGLLQFNSATGLWKVFNTREGLPKSNLIGNLTFTQNEKILVGIEPDIIVFDPFRVHENNILPVMHISGFDVLGKNYLTDTLPGYKKSISLAYNQNQVDISVTAIETLYPEKLKIYYRLNGLDTAWKFSDSRHISFASLAPGDYTFEVIAFNSDGYQSKTPAVIAFTINKPFWKTIWFIALCIIAFTWLIYTFYRYRIRQILKLQEVKNRISADLHDDIGSRLTNIQLLTHISKKQSPLDAKALKHLENIQDEVFASSEALHEIVTNMRVKDDDMEDLAVKLRRYAAQVFELTKADLKIEIEDNISAIKLHPEKRSDLFLIYKELLNNTRKHAAAKKVRIVTKKEKKNILLRVIDNGKGFDTAIPSSRNGLKIIQSRVAKWKGKTTISSDPQTGTTVEIIIPV